VDAPTYQTLKRIYQQARERRVDERAVFLDQACGGDAGLRAEVETLLAQEEGLGDFLRQPAAREPEPAEEPTSHPERIGAYRILRPLGWGGMGVVYLAEQDSPKRAVALKLLRLDAASPNQVARFEREAELLGGLSHPAIARVYEAGWAETETGRRPFFAMEFVEGRALHEYANEHQLDLAQKLRLVCQVSEAAHYAHERGIVHRDLKPSNVLIDERGEPKVLDFGVARSLSSDSRATQTGQLVGTLAYMSPEQATGRKEIDARSDVYSLGVLLYELLTGRLPIVTEGLPLHEAVRRIREEEPIRAGSVRRELEGDLETVLDRALEKEPERRYATAAEFAEDLRLFLDQRPIRARRPTSLYVGLKLVRRHRVLSATVVALFLALSAAQYVSLRFFERDRTAKWNAEARGFWRELAVRQRILDEIKHLEREGEWLLNEELTPPLAKVEEWLANAERMTARLETQRLDLERTQVWLQVPQKEEAIALPEEKQYALEVQTEIVERTEAMIGPRGLLPRMRLRLEQLRPRSVAEQDAGGGRG